MDNIGKRAVIRYLVIKGMSSKDIHKDMLDTLGEDAPSYTMVKKWTREYYLVMRLVSDRIRNYMGR